MPWLSGYPRPCEFSLHIILFDLCAFVSCVFRREKRSISRTDFDFLWFFGSS